MLVKKIYFDFSNRPVELVTSCYHPARYTYVVELGRTPTKSHR
jgi:DNA-binding GntR family transcriptional regulator